MFVVEAAGDKVAEKPNEGTDEIRSSVDYTLKNNVENLTLTGIAVAGIATPSTIWSSATRRANTLYGATGNDTLTEAWEPIH